MIVYTTVFGNTDPLHEPADPGDARFVCFADRPIRSKTWEVIRVDPTEAPSRECRRYKQRSHVVFPDAEWTLWIDAAFELQVPPERIILLASHDVMGFKHPDRRRISVEAPAIVKAGKGREPDVMAQLAVYQSAGWDTDANPQRHITNGGFLLRRHTPAVRAFNEAWHREVQTRCLRDQMSIDYCAWKTGVEIGYFDGNVRNNKLAQIHFMRGKRTTDF